MSNDNARDQDRVWQLMKKIGFAMLVTDDGGKGPNEPGYEATV